MEGKHYTKKNRKYWSVIPILITNARIFTMAGKAYESGCILIEDSAIVEVSESISASKNKALFVNIIDIAYKSLA